MKRRLWALVFFCSLASTEMAFGSGIVNGFGGGSVTVSVWCNPNAPPAAPDATAFGATGRFVAGASAAIPGVAAPPSVGGAPLPAGCNAATFISGTNVPFWDTTWAGAEVGGDKTAGDGAALLQTLTPVDYSSSYSLSVSGSMTSPTTALFTGSYMLSDSGTAFSIEWFSLAGGTPGSPLLLASIPETTGAASGSISMSVTDPFAGLDPTGIQGDLEMETDVAGTSLPTPEPVTMWLCFGSLAIVLLARIGRRAKSV